MGRPARLTNDRIIRVALRLLARKGIREFTAQSLADELGITPGALFRHFTSMKGIVDAITRRMEAVLFERFPPGDPDPIRNLETFFRQRVAVIRAHPDISRLLQSQHLGRAAGAGTARRLSGFKRRSQKFVRECLARAAREGRLAQGLDPKAAAVIVLGAIHALSHAGTRVVNEDRRGALAERVWRVIENLLCGRQAR